MPDTHLTTAPSLHPNPEGRKRLWNLIETGISLRDKGLELKEVADVPSWTTICLAWEREMVNAALEVDYDLGRCLKPLGSLRGFSQANLAERAPQHQKNIEAMTEVIRLVRGWLAPITLMG